MASYKLVEVENAQAKYDLLCDNEVALKPYFCTKSARFNFFLQTGAVST